MNIDIRNIDDEFEKCINDIKETYTFCTTNTKAVRKAVVSHLYLENEIHKLKLELNYVKQKYDSLKTDLDDYFSLEKELKSRLKK